jgi:hypothetical protein
MDFPKEGTELATIKKQLQADSDETGKTITFVTVEDFARLTRLAPAKRLGLGPIEEQQGRIFAGVRRVAWQVRRFVRVRFHALILAGGEGRFSASGD